MGAGADWRSGWRSVAGACSGQDPEAAPAGCPPRFPEGAALLRLCLGVCVYCDFAKYSRTRDRKRWSPRTRERCFRFKQLLGAPEVFQRHRRENRKYGRTSSNLAPWTPVGLALTSVSLSFGGCIVESTCPGMKSSERTRRSGARSGNGAERDWKLVNVRLYLTGCTRVTSSPRPHRPVT